MCGIKTVQAFVALSVEPSFCRQSLHAVKNRGQHSENKKESCCEKEYKRKRLNGESYYVLVEVIVSCNCSG